MKFLSLDMFKAIVRSPECTEIIEGFHRTLNEQVFQITNFDSLEQVKEAIKSFIDD